MVEERERFPESYGWKFNAPLRLRIPLMANASRKGEMHSVCQSAQGSKVAELIDL